MEIQVLFYSRNGDLRRLAEAAADGVAEAGADATLMRIPGAEGADDGIATATPERLLRADGYLFGIPARLQMICPELRRLIEQVDGAAAEASLRLAGRVAAVFTDHNHQRPQATLASTHAVLLNHGLLVTALPGALRSCRGEPGLSATALADARAQGRQLARAAARLGAPQPSAELNAGVNPAPASAWADRAP